MSTTNKMNWKPLIAIIFSMIMMYITSFSINVLIGPIVQDLNWSVSGLQMVIVAASLVAGTLMVTAGRLGDKIGKKKVFLIGSIIYTIGLTTVVLSPNSFIFSIAWAVIWPLGMVMVIPTSIALIMYFYQGPQRAQAFGIYGAVLMLISALAPLIVGYLASSIGWRIALGLSPAFGIITIIMAFGLPETSKDKDLKIDLLSVVLSVVSFGLLLIATTMASQYGWFFEKRPFMIGESSLPLFGLSIVPFIYLLSVIMLVIFFKRGNTLMAKGQSPLLNAAILKNIPFTIGMMVQALLFFLFAAILFVVSVFVQSVSGFDSFDTALTTLPISAGVAIFSFFTPGLGRKIAPKWIIIAGFVIVLIGSYILRQQVAVEMSPLTMLFGSIIFGVGCGLVMGQIASVTMIKVAPEQNGEASGLSETMKEIIGQGFAIAFAGAVLFGSVYTNMTNEYEKVESIDLSIVEENEIMLELEDTFQSITPAEEQEIIKTLPEKTQLAYQDIVNTSAVNAFTRTLLILDIFTIICIIFSFFLPNFKMIDE